MLHEEFFDIYLSHPGDNVAFYLQDFPSDHVWASCLLLLFVRPPLSGKTVVTVIEAHNAAAISRFQ